MFFIVFNKWVEDSFKYKGRGHEVHFYESEPELAMILYNGKYQYYIISQDNYNALYRMYAIRSYRIPEGVIKAITDGKRTKKQSIQDTPVDVDYKVLKIGNERYYIYENERKYYCELPYQFINEISEDVYKSAIEFADTFIQLEK